MVSDALTNFKLRSSNKKSVTKDSFTALKRLSFKIDWVILCGCHRGTPFINDLIAPLSLSISMIPFIFLMMSSHGK